MAFRPASAFRSGATGIGVACVTIVALLWFGIQPAKTQIPLGNPVPSLSQSATGEILASTCAGCHGEDGNSEGPAIPSIAGISVPYFMGTMEQYREGRRNSTIMNRVALGYSFDEVQAMAFYFATQRYRPAQQSHDPKLAKRGALIHKRYCEHCHRDGGSQSGRAGILAGQWKPYLQATLTDMVTGKREMPRTMKRWMDRLIRIEGNSSVEALMHFYASYGK